MKKAGIWIVLSLLAPFVLAAKSTHSARLASHPSSKATTATALAETPEFKPFFEPVTVTPAENGYQRTSLGFFLSDSLVQKAGAKRFAEILQESLVTGTACLYKLKGRGSNENLRRLAEMIRNLDSPPRITISEMETANGLGSDSVDVDYEHPILRLSPELLSEKAEDRLKSTLFHELMHNLGYRHTKDIEYPYGCQACCFPEKEQTFTKLACRICAGNYTSVHDPKHLKDAAELFGNKWLPDYGMRLLGNYFQKHPTDREAQFLILRVNYNPFGSLFAGAFATELEDKYPNLSEFEKAQIVFMKEFRHSMEKEFGGRPLVKARSVWQKPTEVFWRAG